MLKERRYWQLRMKIVRSHIIFLMKIHNHSSNLHANLDTPSRRISRIGICIKLQQNAEKRREWQLLVKILRSHIIFSYENLQPFLEQLIRKLRHPSRRIPRIGIEHGVATKCWKNDAGDNCWWKLYDTI